ncbi:MAG: M20/M25/M40 family metallo-hydrolase [Candidatus Acidiferrales bacterium]
MAEPQIRAERGVFVALLLLALVLALLRIRLEPPAPKPADSPAGDFSALRAREFLQLLVGDGLPHPVGSPADAAVRQRLVAILKGFGYEPALQTDFACSSYGSCATVVNVTAILPGREPAEAVLVAAHYDSVPAGPGASDDGVGAASVLEIARALKSLPQPRHSIIFLLDEGEEAGLLGAQAFVDSNPLAKQVRAVVNMDNRGTSGSAAMFETGSANAALMRLYSSAVERPNTSSIDYAAYKLLPNDTDFTVFKAAGYQGFNFGFIGGVQHYHTPLDNFENASPQSMQHEGASALAVLRSLAEADLDALPAGEAEFFDVFARKTIWWPARWTLPASIILYVLFMLEILVGLRHARRVKGMWRGLLGWFGIVVSSLVLAYLLERLLAFAGVFPGDWIAHPTAVLIAFWGLAFVVVGWFAPLFRKEAVYWSAWCGVAMVWALLAIFHAWRRPGMTYPFLLLAAASVLAALPALYNREPASWKAEFAAILPSIVAAVLVFPFALSLYDALGAALLPGVTVCVALVLIPLAPLLGCLPDGARRVFSGLAYAVTFIAAVVALFLPAYSQNLPQRMNFVYVFDADSGKSQWAVYAASGRLPASVAQAASFSAHPVKVFPYTEERLFAADAPKLDLGAPALANTSLDKMGRVWSFHGTLRPARAGDELYVLLPPDSGVSSFSFAGKTLPELSPRYLQYLHGWHAYGLSSAPAEGIAVAFNGATSHQVDVYLSEESFSLPLEGLFLEKARPSTTVATQNGDATIVFRKQRITP